jgi:hypothetical protein
MAFLCLKSPLTDFTKWKEEEYDTVQCTADFKNVWWKFTI